MLAQKNHTNEGEEEVKEKKSHQKTYFRDRYNIATVVLFASIILLIIPRLLSANFPGTTTDEFGYLYQAARFVGWDWSDLMKYYPYYGAGMALPWVPLFMLLSFKPTVLFASIIVLNAILLGISFFVSLQCAKIMFPDWNKWITLVSCFAIVLYPCNYFYARLAVSETMLYLLFWLIIFILLKILDVPNVKWCLLLGVVSSYMVLVHLRSAGIVIGICVFMAYLFVMKRISWKQLLSFVLVLGVGAVIWLYIKNGYYEILGGLNETNTINTDISVTNLVKGIFTDMISAAEGGICHIFYFIVSGGISLFWGIIYIVKSGWQRLVEVIQKKDLTSKHEEIYFFLVFVIISNFTVFYIHSHQVISRYDVAVYGRYIENLVGPVLLCGLYYITVSLKWVKNIMIYVLCVVAGAPFVIRIMENSTSTIFAPDSAVGLGGFFSFNMIDQSIAFSVLKIVCVAILAAGGYYVLYKIINYKRKKMIRYWGFAIVLFTSIYWSYLGVQSEINANVEKQKLYDDYLYIKNEIDASGGTNIVFVQDEPNLRVAVKYLQFLYRDITIQTVTSAELENEEFDENTIFLTEPKDVLDVSEKGFEEILCTRLRVYAFADESQ